MRIFPLPRWASRSETPTEPAPGTGIVPPARERGAWLSTEAALAIGNVYRAVNILVIAGKQLTLDQWRGRELLDPAPIVRRPDVKTTLSAWIAENIASLALTGNAYWLITRGERGPVNVEVLDPALCTATKDGRLQYKNRVLEPDEFRHLKLMRRPGVINGLGPIQAARVELAGARDLRDYGANWFTSGDVPTGVLKTDQHLSADQAKGYKAMWAERDGHGVAVLGAGLSYAPLMINPEDAQFVQVRQFTKTEIATLFGIPARLFLAVVEGGSTTYANIAQDDLTLVRWTLMDYLSEIEAAMTAILPGLQSSRFNLDGILRPDTTTRYAAHKVGIDAGFLTVDEVRAIEGLPPLTATAPTGGNQ